jgi:hypothetical protein
MRETPEGMVASDMLRLCLSALALWLWMLGPAEACRLPAAGPAERMARDYVTVATARVSSVQSLSPERPNRAFIAELEILETIEGQEQRGRVRLDHAERTECPTVLPLPREDEIWVVYLEWQAGDGGPVNAAWPLAWAQQLDPRFGGAPRPGRAISARRAERIDG